MNFDHRYKIYLDWTVISGMKWDNDTDANWVEVFCSIQPFKTTPYEKEMFSRRSWDKVTIRNKPSLSGDAYVLYDTIANLAIDQEIRIKCVLPNDIINPDSTDEIRGYFGTNDCDFDGDKKIVTVTPTILDQYTDLVENMENDVNVFVGQSTNKASWVLSDDLSTSVGASHNIPMELSSSDLAEASTPSNLYSSGVSNSIVTFAEQQYTATFVIKLNATAIISLGQTIKIYLNLYDSSDTLQSENLLQTYGQMTNGTIAETLNKVVNIPKGQYVRAIAVHSNTGDIIEYGNIATTLTAVTVPYGTTDVNINLQQTYLRTYEICGIIDHMFTERFDRSNFNSNMVDLTGYFNANGSPKEMTTGENQNIYTPYAGNSNTINQNIIPELGVNVVTIRDQYLSDIELDMDSYGFELSEVTLYLCRSYRLLSKKYRTRATCKYSRFEMYLQDGETPPESGWTDSGYVNANNERLYTKKPFDGTITDWSLGSLISEDGNEGFDYKQKITSSKLSNYPDSDTSATLPTRDFKDVVKDIYNGTFQSLVNFDVESVFFWNDTDLSYPVSDGINYVTNDTNWLNNIAVLHTYQINPTSSNSEDSLLEISFKDLMADIKVLFNYQIYWWVEEDGTLRIEHLKYIDKTKSTLDLTDKSGTPFINNSKLLTEISSWKYDKTEMYSLIEFELVNSSYKDFTNNSITFDKIVSNRRNKDIKSTLSTRSISTDIRFAIENPTELENGMILLNHDSNYDLIASNVPITGLYFENGNLALSNLLSRYKYEGIFFNGKINGIYAEFEITSRTKTGKEFSLKGLYDYEYFQSILGIGRIESLTHDVEKENTKVTLKYRFGFGSKADTFTLMVSKEGDYTEATDVEFNFG